MAKNNRELQAELEAANKRIAELSQSNQNANSNINNDEPPSWLKTFLEAQLSMQRQTTLRCEANLASILNNKSHLSSLISKTQRQLVLLLLPFSNLVFNNTQTFQHFVILFMWRSRNKRKLN